MQAKSESVNHPLSEEEIKSETLIDDYHHYVAGHYEPIKGVVVSQGKDYFVKTTDEKVLVDLFGSYSTVNQGHVHPSITKAAAKQMVKLTSTSGAYYNERYSELAKLVSQTFGYEKMMPCNGGAEAVEAAIKIAARNWSNKMADTNQPIPKEEKDQAIIVWAEGAYHGQSGGVWSALKASEHRKGFGPGPANRRTVPYGDINALRELFEKEGKNIAAYLVEPIQGEAGVIVPPDGYFQAVRELCTKHGILLIMDEIQTGMGRTGKMLCQENYGVRGDIVTVAKALTGGVGPMSLVLADHKIMKVLGPGGHGSTFGGNPLMSAVSIAAINVIKDEALCEKSARLGTQLQENLRNRLGQFMATEGNPGVIKDIRGKGLFIGLEFTDSAIPFRDALIKAGVMCKQTQDKTMRISPPLTISSAALNEFVDMAEEVCKLIKDGKDLNKNPITPMPERLEKKGILPKFDDGTEILLSAVEEIRNENNKNFLHRIELLRRNSTMPGNLQIVR